MATFGSSLITQARSCAAVLSAQMRGSCASRLNGDTRESGRSASG
jgi:hypothetical protein